MPNQLKLATIHQFWPHFLSRTARAFSAPNQNFTLHFPSSYPIRVLPDVAFSIFQNFLTSTSALCILLASSCTCCLFHTSRNDTHWFQHTTPFDVSFPLFSDPRKSTFLSASAQVLHNLSIPPPSSESWLHTAGLRRPILPHAELSLPSLPL